MPVLPGGPVGLHPGQHRRDRLVEPQLVQHLPARLVGVESSTDHRHDLAVAAQDFDCLVVPGGALFGEAAGFVLVLAGLQGGLLGERDRLHRGRRTPVVLLERLGPVSYTHLTLPTSDLG